MRVQTARAIGALDTPFHYEYDYGSTTELRLRVTARRTGPKRRDAVRLLARNDDPVSSAASAENRRDRVARSALNRSGWPARSTNGNMETATRRAGFRSSTLRGWACAAPRVGG